MKRSKRSILAFGFLAKDEGTISLDFTPPHPIYQHQRPFQVVNTKYISNQRKTSRSNGENQQQTQPTYSVDAGI